MSNHVHMVFRHTVSSRKKSSDGTLPPITRILKNLKSYSSLQANRHLNRNGAFWHPESYDRLIRNNEELHNTLRYTLNNPVKANLVNHWQEWPHAYCKPDFLEDF